MDQLLQRWVCVESLKSPQSLQVPEVPLQQCKKEPGDELTQEIERMMDEDAGSS